jgi:hypothetical protein
MDSYKVPHADSCWDIDSHLEMEQRLNALRLLVCDLLKTNQELRYALLTVRSSCDTDDESSSQSGASGMPSRRHTRMTIR